MYRKCPIPKKCVCILEGELILLSSSALPALQQTLQRKVQPAANCPTSCAGFAATLRNEPSRPSLIITALGVSRKLLQPTVAAILHPSLAFCQDLAASAALRVNKTEARGVLLAWQKMSQLPYRILKKLPEQKFSSFTKIS